MSAADRRDLDSDLADVLAVVGDRAVAITSEIRIDVTHVAVTAGEVRVEIDLGPWTRHGPEVALPAAEPKGAAETVPDPPEASDATQAGKHTVCAAAVGTFYRRLGPTEDDFVTEGDNVEVGDQIAVVEAMKLMLPVESDRSGSVLEILVADGEPVEYGQALMTLVVAP